MKNIDKYKAELTSLIALGKLLLIAMQVECYPENSAKQLKAKFKNKEYDDFMKDLPIFSNKYQDWYSEAHSVIKQLLPDRLADFVKLYEKPKVRKEITANNYVIEDYLQGLNITRGYEKTLVVGPESAMPQFQTQLNILKSVEKRFESSLFDIRQLVQADLLDSEIDEAKELAKNKFYRAAGAICGVIIEKHLAQVCQDHNISLSKKNLAISDLNNALKNNNVIDTPRWRSIQHYADIRNLCDHDNQKEPTEAQVTDLIDGVDKLIKTLF